MPELTCLMTTYREPIGILRQAIDSILNQSYRDFRFLIIVDDPSATQIIDLICDYVKKDVRVSYLINNINLGLALSLNRGINMIDTKYVARMDADDISLPQRFEKQIIYLKANPDVDLLGAYVTCIDYDGNELHQRSPRPCKAAQIKKCMKYMNAFAHPTLMGKTKVFKKFLYRDLKYSQDYDFTCRLLESGCRLENIPESLLLYRMAQNLESLKIVNQRIAFCTIQKYFQAATLNETDVVDKINYELESADIQKTYTAIICGNKFFIYCKRNRFDMACLMLMKSILGSKYQRQYFYGILKCILIRFM